MTDEGVKVNRAYAAAPAQLAPLKSIMFITDPWEHTLSSTKDSPMLSNESETERKLATNYSLGL